jgi:hypothetical protein
MEVISDFLPLSLICWEKFGLNFVFDISAFEHNTSFFIFFLEGLREHNGHHYVDYLQKQTE